MRSYLNPFNLILLIYFKLDYFFTAYISFAFLKLKGSNFIKRTKKRKNINLLKEKIEKNDKKRLAIFVAYHASKNIPKSNLNYLDILNKCSFTTIYLINGNLNKEVSEKLNSLGCYVICRENIGQDFGAYKDGIALIKKYKITDQLKWLLLCNDSNFCLGGKNSDNFIAKFSENLDSNNKADFISLNCNYERRIHYQSYFLCLSPLIFQERSFNRFWKKYIPFNHRYHTIENGEKKFTTKVLNKYRPKIIYTSHELCEQLNLNLDNDYHYLIKNLPKSLYFLESAFTNNPGNQEAFKLGILQIMNTLESYNPSHVFGLLNIIYLKSPFLKQDVMRQGVFSFSQIYEILKLDKLNIEESLRKEIMDTLIKGGTPISYMETRKAAYKKGISINGQIYQYQTATKLLRSKYFGK